MTGKTEIFRTGNKIMDFFKNNFGDRIKISPFFCAKKNNIIKLQYIKGIFHYREK